MTTQPTTATFPRIGLIGVGLMGESMTLRLLERRHAVTVWNREPERLDLVVPYGAVAATSPAAVAAASDIVILCVLDGAAVEACVFGPQGVAGATNAAGKLVIDMSTMDPEPTRALAARAMRQAAMAWVDAPVSGGPAAAREGKLAVMAGGSAEDMLRAEPVLRILGSNVTHMGAVGAGQTAKILNQAIVGVGFALISEVVLLAEAAGIDVDRLPACLAGGFADSVLLQKLYPRIHQRAFDPPIGYARQLSKDMQAVATFAEQQGCSLPVVKTAVDRFAAYVAAGKGMADSASIIRLYEDEMQPKK